MKKDLNCGSSYLAWTEFAAKVFEATEVLDPFCWALPERNVFEKALQVEWAREGVKSSGVNVTAQPAHLRLGCDLDKEDAVETLRQLRLRVTAAKAQLLSTGKLELEDYGVQLTWDNLIPVKSTDSQGLKFAVDVRHDGETAFLNENTYTMLYGPRRLGLVSPGQPNAKLEHNVRVLDNSLWPDGVVTIAGGQVGATYLTPGEHPEGAKGKTGIWARMGMGGSAGDCYFESDPYGPKPHGPACQFGLSFLPVVVKPEFVSIYRLTAPKEAA